MEAPEEGDDTERPLVVQGACGLGRVVVVAVDLDEGPFIADSYAEGQRSFWGRLLGEFGLRAVESAARSSLERAEPGELADTLQRGLEEFDGVTAVPFGVVALLILLYIALVGPLDYFLLKKVFKRLEWTWVTFPLLVVAVCVAVYFSATALKGDQARGNRLDVVEVDLAGGRVYGTTWLTVFSPRITSYTVGAEPEPAWASAPAGAPLVSVLETPARAARLGAAATYRQAYAYAPDATALERVPVAVWATRSFSALWVGRLDPARPPVGGSLRMLGEWPSGKVVNNLPVRLRDPVLFFRGKCYPLREMLPHEEPYLYPGQECRIDQLFSPRFRPQEMNDWLAEGAPKSAEETAPGQALAPALKALLFHDTAARDRGPNSGLRRLDQSWRLMGVAESRPGMRDEVILLARTGLRRGPADALQKSGALPADLKLDPSLDGPLTQETFVRVYIPVSSGQ
jgi:hypothetical protein